MTKAGTGATMHAPGRAAATVSSVISSSDPLPRITSKPSGTPRRSQIIAFSAVYVGTG